MHWLFILSLISFNLQLSHQFFGCAFVANMYRLTDAISVSLLKRNITRDARHTSNTDLCAIENPYVIILYFFYQRFNYQHWPDRF